MSATIGPCHVKDDGGSGAFIFDDTTHTWQATCGDPDAARVFAAGPELLAACEQIAERRFLVDDDADERDQMVAAALAAIAKAKGAT